MRSSPKPTTAVLLPGTGSDADFVARAFGPALRARGFEVVAVEPDPLDVVASYLRALDDATRADGPIVAAGVSLGAAVAANWAKAQVDAPAAVLAVLPPWIGEAGDAPAAVSARFTAAELRRAGLDEITATMRAGSPDWLGAELARSWRSQWPGLPAALDEAAAYRAPDVTDLASLQVPVGIVSATDDLVHPTHVAHDWARHLPRARVEYLVLADIAADPGSLGRAALRALDAVL